MLDAPTQLAQVEIALSALKNNLKAAALLKKYSALKWATHSARTFTGAL
jgi:hypothetical protein